MCYPAPGIFIWLLAAVLTLIIVVGALCIRCTHPFSLWWLLLSYPLMLAIGATLIYRASKARRM
jgi:hypothetical protein